MFGLPAIFLFNLLPGLIAAGIAENNGMHPAIGFAVGALFSWPGMVMIAIASGIMRDSSRKRRKAAGRPHGRTAAQDRWPMAPVDARKRALTPEEIDSANVPTRQQRLRAERERLAALQREAKILRHNTTVERQQSAAAIASRDELLAAREAEIERLRTALEEAANDRDPWYRDSLAPVDEAMRESLPDALPADMPRQSFEAPRQAPREEAKSMEAGAEGNGES
jgi:hypothetical protein